MNKGKKYLFSFLKLLINIIHIDATYVDREYLSTNLYMWYIGLNLVRYTFFRDKFNLKRQLQSKISNTSKNITIIPNKRNLKSNCSANDAVISCHNLDINTAPRLVGDESNKKKKRPNYFVAFQITDEQIHTSVKLVQEHILKQNERLQSCLISRNTLHITLMVMHLKDLQEHSNAMKALTAVQQEYNKQMCLEPLTLEFLGMGHFGNRVLYAKITKNSSYNRLCDLARSIHHHLAAVGIYTTDTRKEFNPHLTIAKLDYSKKSLKGIKKLPPSLYEEFMEFLFGNNTVKSIQLLKMVGPKSSSGYYSGDELYFSTSDTMSWKKLNKLLAISEKKKEIRNKISKLTVNVFK